MDSSAFCRGARASKNWAVVATLPGLVLLTGSSRAPCPPDMVEVPAAATCIDRYEWPNKAGQKPLLGASALPEERDQKNGIVMDATTLCKQAGKRVCQWDEWLAACLGPDGTNTPWGDNEVPRYTPGERELPCNADKRYRAANERQVGIRDPREMRRLDQSEPSGSRADCVSAVGAYDMIGNGEEWVKCPGIRTGWCLAGRHFAEARVCSRLATGHAPRWHYYSTAFRCCKDQQ